MPTASRYRRPRNRTPKNRRMTRSTDEQSLIEELNERQNDVLDRLAELNGRVESLLNECLAGRDAKQPTMEQSGRVGEKA